MGMDVYGVAPAGEDGKYFRASIWMWRPIWERLRLHCSDLLGEELLSSMAFNDGAGPQDQETCSKIAERLEEWLSEDPREKFSLEEEPTTLRINTEGKLVSLADLAANPKLETRSPYFVSREDFREFIAFLRSCGGFCVW